jgi:hypothetical protein
MAGKAVAHAAVAFTANTGQFEAAMGRSRKAVGGLFGEVKGLRGELKTLAAAWASLTVLRSGWNILAEAGRQLDDLADTAQQLGMSAQNLYVYQYAAKLAGSSTEALAGSISKMDVAIGRLKSGDEMAAKMFGRLGLAAKDFASEDTADSLQVIADKMGIIQSRAERIALAAQIFGKSGARLADVLSQPQDKLKAELQSNGLIPTAGQMQAADVADVVYTRWKEQFWAHVRQQWYRPLVLGTARITGDLPIAPVRPPELQGGGQVAAVMQVYSLVNGPLRQSLDALAKANNYIGELNRQIVAKRELGAFEGALRAESLIGRIQQYAQMVPYKIAGGVFDVQMWTKRMARGEAEKQKQQEAAAAMKARFDDYINGVLTEVNASLESPDMVMRRRLGDAAHAVRAGKLSPEQYEDYERALRRDYGKPSREAESFLERYRAGIYKGRGTRETRENVEAALQKLTPEDVGYVRSQLFSGKWGDVGPGGALDIRTASGYSAMMNAMQRGSNSPQFQSLQLDTERNRLLNELVDAYRKPTEVRFSN